MRILFPFYRLVSWFCLNALKPKDDQFYYVSQTIVIQEFEFWKFQFQYLMKGVLEHCQTATIRRGYIEPFIYFSTRSKQTNSRLKTGLRTIRFSVLEKGWLWVKISRFSWKNYKKVNDRKKNPVALKSFYLFWKRSSF